LFFLEQRGPTSFNLQAILQKHDNSWATSKKMVYETTYLQHLAVYITAVYITKHCL